MITMDGNGVDCSVYLALLLNGREIGCNHHNFKLHGIWDEWELAS